MALHLLRAAAFVVVFFTSFRLFAAAPTVSTSAATMITTSSAVLNGSGNPNGEATTGWFRISPTNPGTCDDTFGTRVPALSGTDLGTGASSVPYGITTTGLSAGVTYYFCAIVSNASGMAFGGIFSFTVPAQPTVVTGGVTGVTSTGATLQGSANPNASSATGWFRYSTTNPGTCNDSFGTRAPASGGSSLGSGTSLVDYTRGITGLTPGATYYYCAIADNAHGMSFGAVQSFTALANAPIVTTNSASLLTGTTAQLNGSANPGGAATTGWFRYDTTSPGACNDSFGTRAPGSGGSSLGSGNSSTPFSQGITGLLPNTQYYYCAIAQSSAGTSFGTVVSFTTPAPPSVTTITPTSITDTSATLRGSGIANGALATGWFRYSLTDPGACDDTFGSRAPVSGGSSLGSGTSSLSFNQPISGLSPGTTYYYCAIASNAEGMSFGAVLSFTTPTAPVAATVAASSVTATTATLHGLGNPSNNAAYGYYRYSATNPGACNDTFGTRIPATTSLDTSLGSGSTDVSYAQGITTLLPSTTYYFCAIVRNTYGTSFGAVLSFTTLANPPSVTTNSASPLTGDTAQLNGAANPGGDATTGWFRYGTASPGTCNDSFGTRAPTTGGTSLGSGNGAVGFSQGITGLLPGTLYYYCAIAQNSVGLSFGAVVSFTTPTPPTVTTLTPTSITDTSATLRGTGIANGSSTTGWFRYSTIDPGACDDTFGSRLPASGGTSLGSGTSSQPFNQSATALSPGTTYYYCAIASSAEGASFGAVLSFTTSTSPTVTTVAATSIAATTATLNGLASPNGNGAYGYFRYSATNPGTCSDAFGTRAPPSSSADTYLGAGSTGVGYALPIGSLLPATTYYYCAIARNGYGTSYGGILSFTTLAAAPSVSTNSASLVTGATAQLNGSANPGGAATTGWFRYAPANPGTCNDTFGTRAPTTGGSSLGSGTSSATFSQGITGLSPGIQYYYCAIAQNAVGIAFGSVMIFTTPNPPTVTTLTPTSITDTSATIRGSGVANGSLATGWLRYSLTDPGVCDDTFGSRAPVSGGSSLGSGTSSVTFSQPISGLSPGTTYYYCAIASSAEGMSFGAVLSFTTPTAPTAATVAASSVTATTATLHGLGNPSNNAAYGYYRYSATNPGACNDTFGTRIPATTSLDTSLGSGSTDVSYAQGITTLLPSTTYYFCAIVRNTYGTSFGAVLSFTTLANPPSVTTNSASPLTGDTAQLNGAANPGGDATTGWFRYGTASPGTCNDSFGTRAPTTGGTSLGSGNGAVGFSQGITTLLPGTLYYYCAIAQNSVGLSFGAVVTFTTPVPPTVTTLTPTTITDTSATLRGTGIPNGSSTTGWFRYSATDPGTCDDTFGSRLPATGGSPLGSGTTSQSFNQSAAGLTPGTTYYYCAIASSAEGTAFGAVVSFTTSTAPTVTTVAATSIAATTATLNGLASPNGNGAYGYYRYSATNPGTCSDSFGTRVPTSSSSDTYLGTGSTGVAYGSSIGSLLPGTTYYFCAIARNGYGTSYGGILSFTTLAVAPTVTTNSASLVLGTSAQLNGLANPGGAATTGWFRYATTSPGSCNDTFGTRAPTTGGSSLGAGNGSFGFSQGVTGLTPGTTYHYCAIAQNAVGLSFGSVVSFTTPVPPTVTTLAPTPLTSTSATLRGSGIANGSTTTGWFRYSLTDPGACDDTFGSRAPVSGGSSLGSGTSSVNFNQPITGLSPGTTYYYCAIASSTEGMAFGAVLSFTTPTAPTTATLAATSVTSNAATLNGQANPNGNSAYGYFRYSASNPIVCNDAFGTRAPTSTSLDTPLGSGSTDVAYPRSITGLTPGTTYYYCAIARNGYGTTFGAVLSFATPATLPSVTTSAASGVTTSTATLNGLANPNGANTTGWFRYATASPGTCNDTFGTRAPSLGGTGVGSGNSSVSFSQGITGLSPLTTYYYCAIAQNSVGTSFGAVVSFTTTSAPTVSTLAATPVTATTATLNAAVNPNGYATTGWFRYSTTNPGACDTSFGTSTATSPLGSSTTLVGLSQSLSGLAPATTYYFCAIAQSSIGTTLGAMLSFTTPAAPPTVTTVAPSGLTDDMATLNATINPNGSATTAWFRYSNTNPGTCNDSFGTRVPATGGVAIGGGNTPVDVPMAITGLTSSTTYYYCALAASGIGTSVGSVVSFTTAAAPSVTTSAATSVLSTSATLNGAANPNVSATTGWFRYDTTNPGTCDDVFGTRAPATGGSSLGAGSNAVSYSQPVTGLLPATTYYYCAIAQNAVGTSFGAVLSFTTTSAPTVTTGAATAVAGTTATLNGTANPNLVATTGWFRYSAIDPGTCDDTFGTRAPTSGGASLGAGGSAVPYSQSVSGLTAGTTYYYCAIASSSVGVSVGAVLSFTTAAAPTVTTSAATAVTTNGATLNGSASPNQLAATGWFRYNTTSPGTCNDTFGTRSPTSGGTSLGAGTSAVPYAQSVTGLAAGTTYYYCAIANNSLGARFGAVMSVTTTAPPSVTSAAATAVTSTGATLNGSSNPNNLSATGWFRYSTTSPGTCNDTFGARAPLSGGASLGSGSSAVAYAQPIAGLTAGTTYYFCAIADNAVGAGFGSVLSFKTLAAPTATTNAASAVASTTATLNGSSNPNLDATTGWFRYDTTNPGTCDDTFGTRAPASGGTSLGAGSSAVAFPQAITGLTPATTYYYCAIAQNSVGTSFGAVMSFTTTAAPLVTSAAATSVTGTGATLNGSANPNNLSATGWFRYSTTNPGTCNDTFGTRAPTSGGTALGAGSTDVAYVRSLSGLVSATTYYYCAIASNSVGTGFGAVLSFTTAGAPSVTTVGASSVATTTATLDGSANPNLLATTAWFRYSTTSPGTCNDTFGTRAPLSGGTALGNGSSAAPYAQPIAGLNPGTTYYFCAIASNSVGTRFGAVMSFTTQAAPSVASLAATSVTSTGATLNGSSNPNLVDALGWFRYDTTNPGTCNDTFGTRAPLSGAVSLGNGSSAVPYSQSLAALTPGTTYYFCAIADNAVGTGFGSVLSFTTPATPAVTTVAASPVASTTATIRGSASPGASATTGWLRYDTTNPGTCDDVFGVRAPLSGGTSLGAGSTPVAYSQPLTGLVPGTTYYFCAIAQNAVGTSFGAVLSFSTTAAPSVSTALATSVTGSAATLNGSATPNQASATGWFRYSPTNPGTCNDTFGTRAPLTGGTSLGAGGSPVAYSAPIAGLAPGMTYYYCAIAQNALGTGVGVVLSFTTPSAPAVVTLGAGSVTSSDATLDGAANPNLDGSTGWFRYSATDPGACNDTFGTRAPATGGAALGAGLSPVPYSQPITGLAPATTYYFCAIAQNSLGTSFGAVMSFATTGAPTVITQAATAVTSAGATIHGSSNPNLVDATGWFRYDTTDPGSCNDTFGTRAPLSGGTSLGNGGTAVAYSNSLTGLLPGTTYYYCAIADNAIGVSFGAVMSFTTAAAPSVTTDAPTAVLSTVAMLNGSANPNQAGTTAWFRYDTTDPGVCDDAFGVRAPAAGGTDVGAGSTPVAYVEPLTGLAPLTTYYYCAIAQNAVGTSFGAVLSFTTSGAPTVTTVDAANVTSAAATLNGSLNPNLSVATGWFRYDTTDPGTCDDAFGTRAPATGGTDVGAGSAAVDYSEPLTGLLPGTTYYFCAIGESQAGTALGDVLSFTTPADPPSVTTDPPTNVSPASATLHGSANPGGDATTGWFRYDTTDPGTCDDTFGTRAPATGGTALGSGAASVAFSEPITGLTAGMTYYYCAVAQNAQGTRFGEIVSFVPDAVPPTVTTEAPIEVLGTSATVAGTANPNEGETTGWFRYGDFDPGTCDDSFGTRSPETGGIALGAGVDPAPYSQELTGLLPKTTYYYCAAASNWGGAVFGEVLSFTTVEAPPVVKTAPPEVGKGGTATLNGAANPNASESTAWFRFDKADPGECNDTFGTRAPSADGTPLGDGRDDVGFSEPVSGLGPGTYYVCAIGSNAAGLGYGEVLTFEIPEEAEPPTKSEDGGCGCRVGASGGHGSAAALVALLVLAFRRRRRRS